MDTKFSFFLILTCYTFALAKLHTAPQEINYSNTVMHETSPQSLITNFSFLDFILNNSTSEPYIQINDNSTEQVKHVECEKNSGNAAVEIVNRTELLQLLLPVGNATSSHQSGRCLLIFFYAPFCPFSSMAAPYFNALPRVFPDIKMAALDASLYQTFNTQYGIVGIPTLLLFHQGRPIAKFNNTLYNLEMFIQFVTKYTKIKPVDKYMLTTADFFGPLSSIPDKRADYFLIISWIFLIICAGYYFSKSSWWKSIVEAIKNNWRESEAQHEHTE
ncbi:thioredoxin domain-containing protein 15 [Ctenocephalides felis]|uniref:thioredoxin domain-containing protein 15 n=1 Tax=Ctenocephalides felis TaxID=7515 RepID=UPI000E6E4FA0|nr:thioredoxin domain-containing protein 15 [Ctenocephalides felis]